MKRTLQGLNEGRFGSERIPLSSWLATVVKGLELRIVSTPNAIHCFKYVKGETLRR